MRLLLAIASVSLLAVGVSTAPSAAGQAPEGSSAQGRMLKPNALIHVVANVQRSMLFYRDVIGLELLSAPASMKGFTGATLLHQARGTTPSAQAGMAAFAIPGSEMQLVLLEFSGIAKEPMTQELYDPGITRFSIQVRDIDVAFNRVKSRGIVVNSTGGGPVFTQQPRNNTRAVMMHDPDGFVFEFVQADPLPETAVPKTSNVYNARSSLAIEDTEKSLAFYRDLLGYEARPSNTVNEAVLALEGTPTAAARTTSTSPPGSTNVWFLWEFSGIARTKHEPHVQDPGASALSLLVENISGLLTRMREAGVKVETPSAGAVSLAGPARGVLVRSPDGLLVELIERTQ